MKKTLRTATLTVMACGVLTLSSSCFSLHREVKAEAEPAPVAAINTSESASEAPQAAVQAPALPSNADLALEFLLADDQEGRMAAARTLCQMQAGFLAREALSEMERSAQYWLEEYLEPTAESSFRRSMVGPRAGIEDLHHTPGYEIYVEAAGGLLIFTREGVLLGRVGDQDAEIADLAFLDIDGGGQSEIFLKYDSGGNSGNRFTRIFGFKEKEGAIERVLKRKLYETAYRWVPAGLGSRLTLMKLAGLDYLVVDPEGEMEVLRWDGSRGEFVRENRPTQRSFLESGGAH